jgi:hypothetical protein
VSAVDGGGLVAVGAAGSRNPTSRAPAAWRSDDGGGTWRPAAVDLPDGPAVGQMNGVVATGGGLVAVGWVGTGRAGGTPGPARPAAWVSADGRSWQVVQVDLGGRSGPAEMHDVAVVSGGLVAVGQDRSLEEAGDGAVWTSTDGRSWTRLNVSGVDGLGGQTLDRVVTLADDWLLTVGQ